MNSTCLGFYLQYPVFSEIEDHPLYCLHHCSGRCECEGTKVQGLRNLYDELKETDGPNLTGFGAEAQIVNV